MGARRLFFVAIALLLPLTWTVPASRAMFMRPMLTDIPIAKLVDNLEKIAAKDRNDSKVRFNLARAHAMAYAEKVDSCQINMGVVTDGPWFGFTPKLVPFNLKQTTDEAKLKAAREHLDMAIVRYKETVQLDPNNTAARLGLAWCTEQAKDKDGAVKQYRAIIEDGWKQEMNLKNLGIGGNTITVEAAGYLVPLLDPNKDQKEIATLKERTAKLNMLPRPVTPVVVPLRDGLTAHDMVNPQARVRFDADGRGFKDEWTWFTKDAGILVYDPNGKRNITSAIQWFGNVTFWMFWDNGYEALKALDDNGDGQLTGKELDGIAVWVDANADGICQPGEVKTLVELEIIALSCRYEIDTAHPDRIPTSRAGVTFGDSTTRPTFDVLLRKINGSTVP